MTTKVTLESPTSDEKMRCTVAASVDPTGSLPEWQLTPKGSYVDPGDWLEGEWEGTYLNGSAAAVSPLTLTELGVAPATTYSVWLRVTIGEERIERLAGVLAVKGISNG